MRILNFTDGFESSVEPSTATIPAEHITVEPSGNLQEALEQIADDLDLRALDSDLENHEALSTAHGVTGEVVGTTDIQILSNKDIDGGTASDTSRITLPKADKATLDGLTRKQGSLVFATDQSKAFVDDGTNLIPVGSGSGGGINFIAGGDASTGNILTQYADSGATPTDGTGGTPNVTSSINTTNPLTGNQDFLITKDAVNRQGEGWSTPSFSVAPAYRAKSCKIRFNYIVNSGTFAAGTTSANSDVTVWVFDETNNRIIQPSNFKFFSNSLTVSDDFEAEFQTSATGASYRLLLHVASTSASAFSLQLTNISVGPSEYVFGSPVTDWQSYTPTVAGLGTGSLSTNVGQYRRVGSNIEVYIRARKDASAGSGGSTVTFTLPAGLSANSNIITIPGILSGEGFKGSGADSVFGAYIITSTTVGLVQNDSSVFTGVEWLANQGIDLYFTVPIQGWSSSVQMSDSYSGRVVASRSFRNTDQSGLNPNISFVKLAYNAKSYDQTNSFDTANNRFIAPTPGIYTVNAVASFAGNNVLNTRHFLSLYKNGVRVDSGGAVFPLASAAFGTAYDGDIELDAGDYLEIYLFGGGNNSSNTLTMLGGTVNSRFSVHKNQGPTAIAATETIAARYTHAGGQAFASGAVAIINFGTSVVDTHGSVTTGASWRFTASASGLYDVDAGILWASSANWADGAAGELSLFKNGTGYSFLDRKDNYSSAAPHMLLSGSDLIRLQAGDYIDIRAKQGTGSSLNTHNDVNFNRVVIKRIGL